MELDDVLRTNGAVRSFRPDPIDDSVVRAILDTARFAPSGGNRQPWRVIIVKDPAVRQALSDATAEGARLYNAHLTAGKVPFAPGPDGRWHGLPEGLEVPDSVVDDPGAAAMLTAPVVLVITVDLTRLAIIDNGLDRQSFIGGGSIYPFVHNILLAAREQGLGGVMTTVAIRDEERLRDVFHLPRHVAMASVVALGRPEQQVTKLKRRAVEQFTTIDAYDGEPFGS
jgi:nitroreductase